VSGVCGFISLWPRDYLLEEQPQKYLDWTRNLAKYYRQHNHSDLSHDAVLQKDMLEVETRIATNHQLNEWKSRWLFTAFKWLAVAVGAELVSLGLLLAGLFHAVLPVLPMPPS